jgi:hypothetical protein
MICEHLKINRGDDISLPLKLKDNSIETVAIRNAGIGYSVNDVLSLRAGNLDATLTVTAIGSLGEVTGVSITSTGTNYKVENNIPTTVTPSGGTQCTIDVTSLNPLDITGYKFYFTLKKSLDDADPGVLQISWTTHIDPTNGLTTLTITHDQTKVLIPGPYFYDIQYIDGGGLVNTPAIDVTAEVIADSTRAVT